MPAALIRRSHRRQQLHPIRLLLPSCVAMQYRRMALVFAARILARLAHLSCQRSMLRTPPTRRYAVACAASTHFVISTRSSRRGGASSPRAVSFISSMVSESTLSRARQIRIHQHRLLHHRHHLPRHPCRVPRPHRRCRPRRPRPLHASRIASAKGPRGTSGANNTLAKGALLARRRSRRRRHWHRAWTAPSSHYTKGLILTSREQTAGCGSSGSTSTG